MANDEIRIITYAAPDGSSIYVDFRMGRIMNDIILPADSGLELTAQTFIVDPLSRLFKENFSRLENISFQNEVPKRLNAQEFRPLTEHEQSSIGIYKLKELVAYLKDQMARLQ